MIDSWHDHTARASEARRRPGARLPARRALCCLSLLLAAGVAGGAAAEPLPLPPVVPPRQVEQQQATVPAWKATWDEARQAARKGNFAGAASLYETLLAQRQGIEEARWELAKVYLHLKQWQRAGRLLDVLLEAVPERLDYLDAQGIAMVEQAHWGRAVELFTKVRSKNPADMVAVRGLVRALLAQGRKDEALAPLEAAYRLDPENPRLRLELARLAYELGHYEMARPHLVALAASPDAATDLLLMAARLHDRLGLENLAVKYWERVVARQSDNDEARRRLAFYFEKAGHFREALPHLLALKRLHPDDPSLLLRIGKGLAASAKPEEALPYLEPYATARPGDVEALELLVNVYAGLGKKSEVLANLERFLAAKAEPDSRKLKQAARLYDAAGRFGDAVTAYRRLLAAGSDDAEARTGMEAELWKLALHGPFEALAGFAAQGPPGAIAPDAYRMTMAAAFAAGGWYDKAADIYGGLAPDSASFVDARLALADFYREAGLPDEEEQVLRQALASRGGDEPRLLHGLFDLALASHRPDEAEVWLRRLQALAVGGGSAWRTRLDEVRLLAAQDDYRAARRMGRRLLAGLPADGDGGAARQQVEVELARADLDDDSLWAARQRLEGVVTRAATPPLEALVLLQRLYGGINEPQQADAIFLQALSEADRADDGLLRLAEIYEREGMPAAMLKVAALGQQRLPGCPRAGLLLAQALLRNHETGKAIEGLKQLVARYPQEGRAATLLARVFFDEGRFGDALAVCERILSSQAGRLDILLIKARSLWALHRQPEALQAYQAGLAPAVAEQLAAASRAQGLDCPPLIAKPGFWQIVSLHGEEPTGFIDTLMSAAHTAAPGMDQASHRLNGLAASYYARYRWQKRFFLELSARRAEQNKEYLYAARQYQAVLAGEPDNGALLFDLAGIYRRLGWDGEEAALYDRLAENRPDFPGLAEVRENNQLRRRPRTSFASGYQREEGWDGYKAVRREWQETTLWLSPRSRHETELSVGHSSYHATDSDAVVRTNRALLTYSAGLGAWLSARLGGGVEEPTDDQIAGTGLLQGELVGKFSDKVVARLAYDRAPVTDTYASVARNIVRKTVKGSGSFDLLPRLQAGGGYTHTDFSDGNRTRGYDFWGAYVLFTDPNYLRLRYQYDFLDSDEGPRPGTATVDGFADNDHPYWAPRNYWINRFSLYYRHQLSEELVERSGPSYYTAEYAVAYDAGGRQLQTLAGGLLWDWTPHFSVHADVTLTSSDVYRQRQVSLAVAYRW